MVLITLPPVVTVFITYFAASESNWQEPAVHIELTDVVSAWPLQRDPAGAFHEHAEFLITFCHKLMPFSSFLHSSEEEILEGGKLCQRFLRNASHASSHNALPICSRPLTRTFVSAGLRRDEHEATSFIQYSAFLKRYRRRQIIVSNRKHGRGTRSFVSLHVYDVSDALASFDL